MAGEQHRRRNPTTDDPQAAANGVRSGELGICTVRPPAQPSIPTRSAATSKRTAPRWAAGYLRAAVNVVRLS